MNLQRAQLDLTRQHFTYVIGDIMLVGSWWMGETDQEIEPCLVLLPAYRRIAAPLPPVITLGGAHLWTDQDYAISKAGDFLDLLGMQRSVPNIKRVVEIILMNIRDLFTIPPLPGAGTVVVADATITGEDGRTRHAEIVQQA